MLFPIVALIFLTVCCVVVGGFLWFADLKDSPRTELKRRLRQMARQGAQDLSAETPADLLRELPSAERLLTHLPLVRGLDLKLDRAGMKISVAGFVGICAALAVLAALVAAFAARTGLAVLPAVALVPLVVSLLLKFKAQRRVEKFTEFFPEALTMIARSLRAGHSFNTAVQLVGTEVPGPVGELFKTAYDQQQLGLRITDGLNNLNHRIESLDLRFFTTIVAINSEIGGNLADVLEKLAETIKERLRIRKQVQVFTAQGRMSGYVLGGLPIFTFVVFNILNPSYEMLLIRDPLGLTILIAAVCMQLLGFLVIRKIIKIRI